MLDVTYDINSGYDILAPLQLYCNALKISLFEAIPWETLRSTLINPVLINLLCALRLGMHAVAWALQ